MARHWLFYQGLIRLLNDTNPAGTFVYSPMYRNILVCLMMTGLAATLKRVFVGYHLGYRLFGRS